MVNIKELAKTIDGLSKEEVIALTDELVNTYGYKVPEPTIVEVESTTTAKVEEKSSFNVIVIGTGPQRLALIKIINGILNIGLTESKKLVDTLPATIKENISREEAQALKEELENAGAEVSLT